MKILLTYLKPYRWLVLLALFMAAINQTFSMLDPYFFGKLLDDYATHPLTYGHYEANKTFVPEGPRTQSDFIWGVLRYLGILIGVAMVSRIAKAFQDYFGNVIVQKFGATIFTDGLSHSMSLPFSEFEDQRSGETLSTLSKVRTDTEKFIISFINALFNAGVGGGFTNKKGKTIVNVYLNADNLFDKAYYDHLSRLKYFLYSSTDTNPSHGIYNMGRNISLKLSFPLDFSSTKPADQ